MLVGSPHILKMMLK